MHQGFQLCTFPQRAELISTHQLPTLHLQVSSNVDRGPLARKRDVGFIYHQANMRELQKQAAELEVPLPSGFSIPDARPMPKQY
jgi:hypothetical protein